MKNSFYEDYTWNNGYKHCISLGWFCGVAASMSRYGLRSHSGPFDWLFSDLDAVIELIQTDFYDFMARENLFLDANDPLIFHDRKYGFICNHDIQQNFYIEYENIFKKYMRRVERFRQDIKQPVCFIRAVRSEKEISYIAKNIRHIYDVIKAQNINNEIIFLITNTMKKLPNTCLNIRLGVKEYIGKPYEMRTLFDTSAKFSEYCRQNILPEKLVESNKMFDKEHLTFDTKVAMYIHQLDAYNFISVLRNFYPDLQKGVYLFGAGTYCKILLPYLIKNKIYVDGIIDNDPEKYGGGYGNISVIPFSQIVYDYSNIFITVAAVKKADEIEKQILEQYPNTKTLKWSNIILT